MLTRLIVVFALAIAVAVGLLVFLSGESHERAVETGAALEWAGEPRIVLEPGAPPEDRVAIGRIRNGGSERIEASADDFEVRDSGQREVFSSFRFVDASAGAPAEPDASEDEELRIGVDLELGPGRSAPLTVRYRLERRVELPVAVYFEGVRALDLPAEEVPPG